MALCSNRRLSLRHVLTWTRNVPEFAVSCRDNFAGECGSVDVSALGEVVWRSSSDNLRYVPSAVNMSAWKPTGQGTGCSLSPTLEVVKIHRDVFTVQSGLAHPASKGGHSGTDT